MSLPTHIFIAYSDAEKDRYYFAELEKHLSVLKRRNKISAWNSAKLAAGEVVEEVTRRELQKAEVILLLISPDFVASDYLNGEVVGVAMERMKQEQIKVVPILIRSCLWEDGVLDKLQPLPQSRKAISEHEDEDAALHDVAVELAKLITGEDYEEDEAAPVVAPPVMKGTGDGRVPSKFPVWALVLVALLVVGVGGFWAMKKNQRNKIAQNTEQKPALPRSDSPATNPAVPPKGADTKQPASEPSKADRIKIDPNKVQLIKDPQVRAELLKETLHFFVVHRKTRRPIEGATIKFNNLTLKTDATGAFELRVSKQEKAEGRIIISHPNFKSFDDLIGQLNRDIPLTPL